MRFAGVALLLVCAWPTFGAAQDAAGIERIADTMVRLCVGGGSTEATSGTGSGGADLSLRSLDVKGNLKGEFTVSKSSAEGLVLEDVALTSDFLAGVLVARKLGVKFALGATMAIRRQVLTEIGGFGAFADAAADDHELGSRVAASGYWVELARTTVQTECASRSFEDFFQHQLRWSVVIRESQPWGHLGFLFAQGLPWVLVAAAVAPSRIIAGSFVAAYLALRLGAAFTVGVWGLRDSLLKRKWWLIPLSDAFAFVVWLTSLFKNRVVWQNSTYEVRNRRLIPVERSHASLAEVGVDRGGGHLL